MGSKNKLKRFKENETFPNVFQPTREILVENKFSLKGHWCDEFFKNNPDKEFVVFCGLGGQGTLATKTRKDMGVKNVKNIAGGMSEWDKLKD